MLLACVQLREVLEKFLDDDDDMHDMNLTALEAERQQEAAREQMLSLRAAGGAETPMDVPLSLGGLAEVRGWASGLGARQCELAGSCG